MAAATGPGPINLTSPRSWLFDFKPSIVEKKALSHSISDHVPERYQVLLRCILALVPVAAVQLLLIWIAQSGQMQDLIQSISVDSRLNRHLQTAFVVNTWLVALIAVWRINRVEDPYCEQDIYGPFFLGTKFWTALVFFLSSAFLYPTVLYPPILDFAQTFIQTWDPGEIWQLLARNFSRSMLVLVAAVTVAANIFFLHRRRRRKGAAAQGSMLRAVMVHFHHIAFGLAVAAGIWFTIWPDPAIEWLGAPTALLIFAWGVISIIFLITDFRPWAKIVSVAVLIVLLSISASFGIRDLRTQDTPSFKPAEFVPPENGPIFLVASDGGGIRAAYWSASVLGAIAARDEFEGFAGQIVALGGASGGSVGLGTFAALLAAKVPAAQLQTTAGEVLGADYISTAASYLPWRDFGVSLTGLDRWGWGETLDDRVTAIEKQLEREFAGHANGATILSGPVIDKPLLYFNTTEVGTGRPYIFGNYDPGFEEETSLDPVFVEARNVPMSSAMFASARFPVISPDARVRLGQENGVAFPTLDGPGEVHELIDGGYADNSGALALIRLLGNLSEADRQRVYAISISNDPGKSTSETPGIRELFSASLEGGCAEPETHPANGNTLRLVASPLRTLDGARAQSSDRWRSALKQRLDEIGDDRFFHLPLVSCKGDPAFILGWTVADTAQEEMDERATLLAGNAGSPLHRFVAQAFARHPPRGPRTDAAGVDPGGWSGAQ